MEGGNIAVRHFRYEGVLPGERDAHGVVPAQDGIVVDGAIRRSQHLAVGTRRLQKELLLALFLSFPKNEK